MLIFLIIDENDKIIAAIYGKNYKRMLYASSKILGMARAEEAVHDVFVKLIEKNSENFENLRDKPGNFFVLIVRNHSINLLKKEDIVKIPLDDGDFEIFADEDPGPDEILLQKEGRERMTALIRTLNPVMREILEYRYILDYSNKEIAETLGVSQSVVSSRIDRAKKALKELYEKEAAENEY